MAPLKVLYYPSSRILVSLKSNFVEIFVAREMNKFFSDFAVSSV